MKRYRSHMAVRPLEYRPMAHRYRDHRPLEFAGMAALLFVAMILFIVAAEAVTAALLQARGGI